MTSRGKLPLDLGSLWNGLLGLSPGMAGMMAEAGSVCLLEHQHPCPVDLSVNGDHHGLYELRWLSVTEAMVRSWKDKQEATEYGAYGVALLLIADITSYTCVQRSRKLTGFDWWLGHQSAMPFQEKARLEVSGRLQGDLASVRTRTRAKLQQIDRSNRHLPGYVVVVEFGQPMAQVMKI